MTDSKPVPTTVPPGLTRGRWLELRELLPERCYVANTIHATGPHGQPPVLCIARGESGYWPIYTRATPATLNDDGTTPAQCAAMLAGSMFGWDTPAADPRTYDGRDVRAVLGVQP